MSAPSFAAEPGSRGRAPARATVARRRRQTAVMPWYPMRMRKGVVLGVLLVLALAGGWMLMRGGASSAGDPRATGRAAATEVEREPVTSRGGAPREAPDAAAKPSASDERVASKQERDALRRRILEAMQAREHAEAPAGAAGEGEAGGARKPGDEAPPRAKAEPPDEGAPTPGNLVDRTGNHGHLTKVMNEDLMPLVDECYALARETQPELQGLLVIDVEMIGDAELGSVVESAALGQGSELVDPSLVECVQESLLSTTLPPPPEGGRDAISLQMRLEPDEG